MARQRIAHLSAQRRLHPGEAFRRRFSLDEDAAQISLVRQSLDRRLVNRLLFRVQPAKNLRGQRGGHSLKNFVRSHPSAHTMTASASSSNGR
jgi:hypothetical protein